MSKRVTITIENIDPDLLRVQREHFISIVADRSGHISETEQDALDGLVNLLDTIQDQADKE